jgi:DNA repair protein RecN (Recombination protein N)
MLVELHIENFAIIDRLDLRLDAGLVAFTGETGAGKSIIVDAVEAILGGRTDPTFVRSGMERATLEGVFHLPQANRTLLLGILEREELLDEPDYLTLGREIRLNGRSVARVNGRNVAAGLLRELGELLVDIHGQSEHLSLLKVSQHLGLLDSFAVATEANMPPGKSMRDLLSAYSHAYQRLNAVRRELDALRQAERDAARRIDMLGFQIQEIEAARLQPGEEEELRMERNRLANAEALAKLAQESLVRLDEGSPEAPSATDLIGEIERALTSLARLDPSQAALQEQAQSVIESLSELSLNLRDYLEGIEFNPRRLDQVEERLALIQTLKRKYGDTIPAVLDFATHAREELETITHASERIEDLTAEQESLRQELAQAGQALSERRKAAAGDMEGLIETELADLRMSGARFRVYFQHETDAQGIALADGSRVAYSPNGLERVEFLIAPNPGEGFKPLVKIASGGETSRLMLALQNVLAGADQVPTLIFDEIDQGIGGRVGTVVGEKLWSLARHHQVLCITHLPQLAAFGEQHFRVEKQVELGRTTTQVTAMQGEPRIVELAQMMGEVSEGTLHSARELVENVENRTDPARPPGKSR